MPNLLFLSLLIKTTAHGTPNEDVSAANPPSAHAKNIVQRVRFNKETKICKFLVQFENEAKATYKTLEEIESHGNEELCE